ncbi:MAG: TMEM165/GDT1 family protein [Myxococcales bacterium]|nr:TMEM165/GDT1 family protein [Myxococcales bacterium]MCB9544401.1 TMEM165/GDT1 family protein [Myxococcales bacterium]
MQWQVFMTVLTTVFLAELGDKTQLATMTFAANGQVSRWTVFAAASVALVAASGIGVLAGAWLTRYVSPRHLTLAAGVAFIAIGAWTLYGALRAEAA